MRRHAVIRVLPRTTARTPARLGLNLETQDHAERTNLWDWVADSGAACLREFHPEVDLRARPFTESDAADIADRSGFDRWRTGLLADPDARIPWDRYAFDRAVPWLGIPDRFLDRVAATGIPPLLSLGYAPKQFARPLVRDLGCEQVPDDAGIDWGAAASAYEYYLAEIWHFAVRHPVAARDFMMLNEPTNRWGWWWLPAEFDRVPAKGWWTALSWNDDLPEDLKALGPRFFALAAVQHAVLSRIARQAVDDVAHLLADRNLPGGLRLTGPTDVVWDQFWSRSSAHLDALDWHHYHQDPDTFRQGYAAVEAAAAAAGRETMISEFGRLSGGTPVGELLFDMPKSLEVADLLLTLCAMPAADGPVLRDATFYLLSYPSTHRNYKQLVYGAMDCVDWTGRDTPLWNRGPAWYPTFEEQQLRWPTPAYHLFRMAARMCAGGPHRVLATGWLNPTSAAPHDIPDGVRIVAVDQGSRLIAALLNRRERATPGLVVEPPRGGAACRLVRVTSKDDADRLTALLPGDGPVAFDLPAHALAQIVFADIPWHRATALRIEECGLTPGRSAALGLWQTTRLRAIATIDGRDHDATTWAVQWDSSEGNLVRVGQGGLVQRLREWPSPVTITARIPGGPEATLAVG